MSTKEKFCKYSKHRCPDCDSKMKIVDITNNDSGVSYTKKYEICEECGYEHDITDKRSNNNKVEIKEADIDKSYPNNKRRDATTSNRGRFS